jgi:chromosome segregation ATPase
MLKLIEEDGVSLAKKAEMCRQTRPDLISKIKEFNSMQQSLAECYEYVTAELSNSIPSEFDVQGVDNSESGHGHDPPLLTPDQKLGFHKASNRAPSVSSHGASSDLSLKEGSESFSFSSSDSESESFNSSGNAYYSLPVNTDRSELHKKIIVMGTDLSSMEEKLRMHEEENRDSMLNGEENRNYEELLSRIIGYEEELRLTKVKLQLSEDDVTRLKMELEKSVFFRDLSGTLQAQLELALKDIQMREDDLQVERKRVLELQKKVAEGSEELQGQLKVAEEEITMLNAKLNTESRRVLDLQERITCYKSDLSDHDHEIKALKDAQENLSVEKAHLQSEILDLSEKQNMLEVKLREWDLQGKFMEDKLRQCETEKMQMKNLHDAQEIALQGEISQLKVELIDRGEHVEVLNKKFDSLKSKYDMLMAEKVGMSAKVNTLIADVNSRDNQIRQMEGHLQQLHTEHEKLIAGSQSSRKLVDELRLKVVELEKEVDGQSVELSAVAEEKRAAIRQLCFSLEHYRSGYKELREAFLGHKRHSVMAS